MASFSVSDAAFAGFKLVRERPKAFGVWVAVNCVISVGFSLLTFTQMAPALAALQTTGASKPDPTASLRALGHLAPLYGLMMLFTLAFYPVVYAAMDRAVLKPEDDRFGYLRFGGDELRQFLLMLLYVVIMFGIYIAGILVFVLIAAMTGVATAGAGQGGGAILAALVGMLDFFAVFGGLIFVAARFSLASPLTFDKQQVDLFGSWRLTKGRVWPLIGTALLVLVLTIILYLVTMVLIGALSLIPGLKSNFLQMYIRPDPSVLAGGVTPGMVVSWLVMAVMNSFLIPLWLTPPAAIYRSLTDGARSKTVAEVFG
ncbi:hypothetical protein [Phenylobacterium montanum]|uniref:Glycerophosphoryl diester phosphodiesterase membrane domain-containing protein n=1 Tax=Phenylobacterium montanum TaxID=2823693 RepID=A0A975IWW2_9CAUL|nr:hypothetical protein [Caulobacter sp. S6]QUD90497.1 hypothetical protein KCG34_11840 [Caulobacter sp. S6]